jgi:preprotein translocase subunit SecD
MRLLAISIATLALAAPAAAATPAFGVFDLQSDLAAASHNAYGDVAVKPRAAVEGHGLLAHCGSSCRFGSGWLAFGVKPALSRSDVTAARVQSSKGMGWMVVLSLRPAAQSRWAAFARRVAFAGKHRGVPDVLIVVARGEIAAAPLSTEVTTAHGGVTLSGFSRASARALASALRPGA